MDKKAADLDHKHGLKLVHFLGFSRQVASIPKPINRSPSPSSDQQLVESQTEVSDPQDSRVFKTAEKKLKKSQWGETTQ